MSDYSMEFDDERVTLIQHWQGKPQVKSSITLPWEEVPALIASLTAAKNHLSDHPAHGRDGVH